ncbi:hypothetical protein KIN20_031801 [Parelaphostrongylus tenuis]|uniref:Uncharacterized protein n=1 Tax=Parelaphostrongylus tenuis TaxID=148309 RepID=A0AAD5R7H6_PARTN|nr:hypothetical protein KIN20_031801 [Parelaphostrongylus tenuis]
MNITPELAPVCTASEPVNIPELTEVVVYSAAVSPKTPPSPVIESSLYGNTSQSNLVASGDEFGVVSQVPHDHYCQVPSSFDAHQPPYDKLQQQPQHQHLYHEAMASPSCSPPASQPQYFAQPCQQYPSYITNYHSTSATAYPPNSQYLQQQQQTSFTSHMEYFYRRLTPVFLSTLSKHLLILLSTRRPTRYRCPLSLSLLRHMVHLVKFLIRGSNVLMLLHITILPISYRTLRLRSGHRILL